MTSLIHYLNYPFDHAPSEKLGNQAAGNVLRNGPKQK
jgi:hypothetical protein